MLTLNQCAPPAKAPRGQSDSSHYYGHTAERGWHPLYTPEKNYSLREARKAQAEGLVAVPSVTTYLGELRKQQVETWKMEQVARACYRNVPKMDEAEECFVDRTVGLAMGASKPAADLGTRIHAAIELAVAGKDYDADMDRYVQPVLVERAKYGLESVAQEKCVGSLQHGYAGKVDDICTNLTISDYKSRGKPEAYPTDWCQIAAYGYAEWGNDFFLNGAGIVFPIATKGDAKVCPEMRLGKDLVQALEAFIGLTGTWRYFHRFDPRVAA